MGQCKYNETAFLMSKIVNKHFLAANVDCMARVNAKNPQRSLHVPYEGHVFAKPCETQV